MILFKIENYIWKFLNPYSIKFFIKFLKYGAQKIENKLLKYKWNASYLYN